MNNFLTQNTFPPLTLTDPDSPHTSIIPLWQWQCSVCPWHLPITNYLQPYPNSIITCPHCGQPSHLKRRT